MLGKWHSITGATLHCMTFNCVKTNVTSVVISLDRRSALVAAATRLFPAGMSPACVPGSCTVRIACLESFSGTPSVPGTAGERSMILDTLRPAPAGRSLWPFLPCKGQLPQHSMVSLDLVSAMTVERQGSGSRSRGHSAQEVLCATTALHRLSERTHHIKCLHCRACICQLV